jgi:hypothetical protein
MNRRRPNYIQERIDLREQRKRHEAEKEPDCVCPMCLSAAELAGIFRERREAAERVNGPVPF